VLYLNNKSIIDNFLKDETNKQFVGINKVEISKIADNELRRPLQSISDYHGFSHETNYILSNYMLVACLIFMKRYLKKWS
jgi:hypothetical protein